MANSSLTATPEVLDALRKGSGLKRLRHLGGHSSWLAVEVFERAVRLLVGVRHTVPTPQRPGSFARS